MKLLIDGMHCQACVRRVEKALSSVEGVKVESVEIGSASAVGSVSAEPAVLQALSDAGFLAKVISN